ncbi:MULTISPECIES: hypothetical protein [unclassified Apibacter]|uniref:hypothetical protein n=3 Tax=Apibacter TaxID=1778601 RepID=UPI00136895C9|nr:MULTISPECIES: hypothetical protein [unclassified Apibacter]MCX8677826.1 hypothetical protein [Apibacter sp. B3919]MXO27147.1 hypothetical protein [Apibacter sp. B3813]MXO28960.1 hypothetical protein [Apibacter sp. B3913]MXO31259.1 hypothetical protein [Apibacter sp. B3912]MXP02454.1 hypothetical protein [Apibacter sp. B3918]
MRKILVSCIPVLVLFSCQGQENKTTIQLNNENKEAPTKPIEKPTENKPVMNNEIDLKKIAEHIELQKRVFVADHTPENEYVATREDLDLQQPLIEKTLFNSGYKFPEYAEFRERVKYLFGIDLDKSKETIVTLYPLRFANLRGVAYTDEEIKGNVSKSMTFDKYKYTFAWDGWKLFIDKERKIIAPMVFLEDLIKINSIDKKEYSVKQNLKVITLNKYLMYGDKAGLTYLLSRENELAHDLLLNFNFDKEDKINKSVMDSLYSKNKKFNTTYEFGDNLVDLILISNYQTDNKLYIREGILKTIEHITNENEGTYAISLIDSTLDLLRELDKSDLTKAQKGYSYKIIGYLANTCDPLFRKYHLSKTVKWRRGNILGAYHASLGEDLEPWYDLKNTFIENNYYNLPHLEEMVAYAEEFTDKETPE